GTTVTVQLTGTDNGGTGTYTVSASQTVASTTLTFKQVNFSLYQAPFFYCNPDDASFPFWFSAEGNAANIQHEQGAAKSADLLSWTLVGPTHITPTFGSWSSFQRLVRTGTNAWTST